MNRSIHSHALVAALALSPLAAHADFLFGRLQPGGGAETNGGSQAPDVSEDGKVYVFESNATNWDASGPTQTSVFVVNLAEDTVYNASRTSTGVVFNGASFNPTVSRDGRYVAMQTFANNLALGTPTSGPQVVRKDTVTGALLLVSANASGTPASGSAGGQARETAISGDGSVVVFRSDAANLVAGDAAGTDDLFAKEASGAITAISVNASGAPVGDVLPLTAHAISADGRYVVWTSAAPNIVPGVPSGTIQVWLRDRQAQTNTLMSRAAGGTPGNSQSDSPSISPNGRFVVFRSFASNLVGARTDGLYVRDRIANTIANVPKPTLAGQIANGCSENDVSDAGVVLMTCTHPNAPAQVWWHVPGAAGTPFHISEAGTPGNQTSGTHVALGAGGLAMAFDSIATNLAPSDTNGVSDVFVVVEESVIDTVFADGYE